MNAALSRHTVWLVVAAFAVAVAPHLHMMPAWLALLIVAAAGWRALAAKARMRPPHWLIRIVLTFGGLALVVLEYGAIWGRRAATVLLCLMIAAKLIEMWRLRDARLVASLCFFLIATQFLFGQQWFLLAYLVAGCWLAVAALLAIQRDADRVLDRGDNGQSPLGGSLKAAAILGASAIPFALVLFALFPRLSSPLWGMPDSALDNRTGVSDRMSPGSFVSLFIDDSPAFRVEFDGPVPDPEERYWRGPVLWRFDGQTWTRMFYSNRQASHVPSPGTARYRYTVQLEPSERRWLFALDYPASWPDDARLTADYELIRKEPVTSVVSYEAASQPDFVANPVLPRVLRRLALSLPEQRNPRTRAFAARLRERFDDDRALIREVLDWFGREPFFYTLEAPPLGRHSADEFLFDTRSGYCEYYASAFAVLMRAAGIPARIVTGYLGGTWNSAGGYLLVRQSDAHAWTEVWLENEGWVRIDPTAAVSPQRVIESARSALGAEAGWLGGEWLYGLRERFDRVRHLWNEWVLGFDAERQQGMLRPLGFDDLPVAARAGVMLALGLLVLVPLALTLRSLVPSGRDRDRLARLWQRLRRRLARTGVRVPPGATPFEIAQYAAARLKNGDELVGLAAQYCRARYGPLGMRAADDPASQAAVERVAQRIRNWRPVR